MIVHQMQEFLESSQHSRHFKKCFKLTAECPIRFSLICSGSKKYEDIQINPLIGEMEDFWENPSNWSHRDLLSKWVIEGWNTTLSLQALTH